MSSFTTDQWLFILRALEWDAESARYYDEADYDYDMNESIVDRIASWARPVEDKNND